MKKLLPVLLGVLCLSVAVVNAQDKSKRKNGRRPALTEEQKTLRKQITEKYDTNKDGKLDAEERKKISTEDKEKMQKAGLLPQRKGKNKNSDDKAK